MAEDNNIDNSSSKVVLQKTIETSPVGCLPLLVFIFVEESMMGRERFPIPSLPPEFPQQLLLWVLARGQQVGTQLLELTLLPSASTSAGSWSTSQSWSYLNC